MGQHDPDRGGLGRREFMVGNVDVKNQQGHASVAINFDPGFFVGVNRVIEQGRGDLIFFVQVLAFPGEGLKDTDPVTVRVDFY